MQTGDEKLAVVKADSGMSLGAVVRAHSGSAIDAIDKLGEWFTTSGLFGVNNEQAGKLVALTCVTEGLTPTEFARTYHIVEGKIQKKAMAAFAEFRRRGGKVRWIETGDTGEKSVAEFTFEGQSVTLGFSMDDARRAELVKPRSNWVKSPGNMLRARVVSNALGMLCPEIFAGEYDDDAPAAGPALNLGAQTAQPAPANAGPKPANVTEARTVTPAAGPHAPAPEVREAKVAVVTTPPPPVSQPDAPPVRSTSQPAVISAGSLPVELQTELLVAIGGEKYIAQATAQAVRMAFIRQGQSLEDLPEAKAREIIARAPKFREKAGIPPF